MNYRKALATVAFALGATASATALASANLVTNGGFETGNFSGWTASVDPSFSGVDDVAAHSGNFGAYFGDLGLTGTISQSFATMSGGFYDIDLWLRSDGQTPNGLQVVWDGATVFSVSNFGALSYTEIVIAPQQATSALSTLELRVGNDNGFLEVDDISVVQAVPEPASFALVGAGLMMVLLRRKLGSDRRHRPLGDSRAANA